MKARNKETDLVSPHTWLLKVNSRESGRIPEMVMEVQFAQCPRSSQVARVAQSVTLRPLCVLPQPTLSPGVLLGSAGGQSQRNAWNWLNTSSTFFIESKYFSRGICHISPPGKWILFARAAALLAYGARSCLESVIPLFERFSGSWAYPPWLQKGTQMVLFEAPCDPIWSTEVK